MTNHTFVLLCVARRSDARVRDIAEQVGITERATQAILRDLDRDHYIERTRIGRRNSYRVRKNAVLRHPLARSTTIGELLDALSPVEPPRQAQLAERRLVY